MVHIIVTEHIERPLIKIGSMDGPVTVQRDIVAAGLIHQHPQGEVGRGIDQEVNMDIRRNIRSFNGYPCHLLHLLRFVLISPGDELLF